MTNLAYKPTIVGEKIVLRPFKEEDLLHLEEILTDKEVIKLTGSDATFNQEVVYNWYKTRNNQKDRLDLAIVDKQTHKIAGEVVLNEYNPENHSMNYRILIGKEGRDRGFGTEVTHLFCNYVFKQTDLKALTLSVFAFNPRAQHVYEKVGFKEVSVDQNELEYEGKRIDSINMILTHEMYVEAEETKS